MRPALWLLLLAASACYGDASSEAERLAYSQHPGAMLPEAQLFTDSDGTRLTLREISAGKPLLLILGYFECPNLCPVTRASLYRALAGADLQAGRDYSLAAISIDPHEATESARNARRADLAAFAPGSGGAIHYLRGDKASIETLSLAVGFHDRWDNASRAYLHPAGVIFATKDGRISSYLLGVGYRATAVREAWRLASSGAAPSRYAAPILLLCFHYDPSTGRYSLEILKVLRLAAAGSVLLLAGVLILLFRGERRAA